MYTLQLFRDGEQITPHDIHDFSIRSAVELELNLVYEAVAHLSCDIHNIGLKVRGDVLGGGKVTFVASACCNILQEEAQGHLAHLPVAWSDERV